MSSSSSRELIALDVGNSRLKAGRFESSGVAAGQLAVPVDVLSISLTDPLFFDVLGRWHVGFPDRPAKWIAASVNDRALDQLIAWLAKRDVGEITQLTDPAGLPLKTTLPAPERAGLDRLLNAVAANVVRAEGKPALLIDAGSAVTVDALSADGVFLGGAIFPGIGLSARALAEFTEKLPLLDVGEVLKQPPPKLPGTSTPAAMSAGLFWSLVGAVREVVAQTAVGCSDEPELVVTGGAAEPLVGRLHGNPLWLPHLTLQGIWQTCRDEPPSLASAGG